MSHTWFLAPDEFAKSAYSGGEPYHLLLPDPAADFRVRGMPGIEEHFVDYLRAVFAGGGFHGRTQPCDDPAAWQKLPPQSAITRVLTRSLAAF